MAYKYERVYADKAVLSKYGKSLHRLVKFLSTAGVEYMLQTGDTAVDRFYVCTGANTDEMPNGDMVIADTVDGILVKYIASNAFVEATYLNSVVIPDSVLTIGESAFRASSLTHVTFAGNSDLRAIGSNAFYRSALREITIPESVEEIQSWAFYGCANLTKVTFRGALDACGSNVFNCCTSLQEVIFSDKMTTIPVTFVGCTALTTITIPDSVTTMSSYIFQECNKLKEVTLSKQLTAISNYAFEGCTSLTNIVIPDNVVTLGEEAFNGCSSLESITLPVSLKSLKRMSLGDCTSLKDLYYEGTMEQWRSISRDGNWSTGTTGYTIHYADGQTSQ